MSIMMNRKFNILYGLVFVIGVALYIAKCNESKKFKSDVQELSEYKDSAQYYIDKTTGEKIALNRALDLSDATVGYLEEQNANLARQVDKFKKVAAAAVIKSEAKVDSFQVTLHDTIPCLFNPISFAIDSSHYKISGRIARTNLFIDGLTIPNEQTLVIGKKKGNIFKKKEYSIEVTNSNPFISVWGLQGYTFSPDKKFYEKPWFWAAVGFGAGFAIK